MMDLQSTPRFLTPCRQRLWNSVRDLPRTHSSLKVNEKVLSLPYVFIISRPLPLIKIHGSLKIGQANRLARGVLAANLR